LTLGTQIKTKTGVVKALKFYKPDARDSSYVLSVWSNSTTKIFSTNYKSKTTGWQRIPVNIPLNEGVYTVSVFNPVGRFSYRKTTFPRTRGSITGQAGKSVNGNGFPSDSTSETYYVDAVIAAAPVVPLSVKVLPDTITVPYGKNVTLTGTIIGQYTSFGWEVLEQTGQMTIAGITTLNPIVSCKDSSGCSIRIMLTATDANGIQQSELSDVYVLPHPEQWIGVITRGGKILWLKNVVILD
jgi:hypothetical protein